MAITARDLMETSVVTVSPDDPLESVRQLFVDEEIHGAPVVDDERRVVGMVSTSDLLRAASDEEESLDGRRVEEVMTSSIVAVPADAPVAEIAAALRRDRVHRVLVLDGGALLGIISAFDLLALLEKQSH